MKAVIWKTGKKTPNCYECTHRNNIFGDAHSSCNAYRAKVVGNRHGIEFGWFDWPFNFDPTWLVSCNSFKQKEKDE